MKKFLILMVCLLVLFFACSTSTAQFLSHVAEIHGTIPSDAIAIFIGKTQISGEVIGYNTTSLLDTSSFIDYLDNPLLTTIIDPNLLQNLHGFPLLGNCSIEDVNQVMIFDLEEIQQVDFKTLDPDDFFELINSFQQFSNVDIYAKTGPFLLGTDGTSVTTTAEIPFAVTTVMSFELEEIGAVPLLLSLSKSPFSYQYAGTSALLYQMSENGGIILKDKNGMELWNNASSEKVLYIKDEDLSVFQDSLLCLLPIAMDNVTDGIFMQLDSAEAENIDILSLVDDLSTNLDEFQNFDISDITQQIQGFDDLLSLASSIVNGGLILLNMTDTLQIDDTSQEVTGISVVRGNGVKVEITGGETPITTIEGKAKLIFLGDHLYTVQAQQNNQGVAIPWLIPLLWGIALIGYFGVRLFWKKEINTDGTKKVKGILNKIKPLYALGVHLIILFIVFLLMDREISFQLGISAVDAIVSQGVSVIFAILVAIELIIWILGYLALAFPISLLLSSVSKIFGVQQESKHFRRGISAVFIWVFCALFLKLIVNVILLIINIENIVPMG